MHALRLAVVLPGTELQKSSMLDVVGNTSSKVFPPAIAGPATPIAAVAAAIKVFLIFKCLFHNSRGRAFPARASRQERRHQDAALTTLPHPLANGFK